MDYAAERHAFLHYNKRHIGKIYFLPKTFQELSQQKKNLQPNLKIFLGVHHGPRKICEEKNKVNKSHATGP